MKYLIEASQFYDAIHERAYFAIGKDTDIDQIDRLERFKKRYILTTIFLGQFEKAHRLSIGDSQMTKITVELVRNSNQFKFGAVETDFSHVIVITSKILSPRYCWIHLLLDSCRQQSSERPVSRVTLQGPSYFEFIAALASLTAHNRILVLVEWPEFVVTDEDLQSIMRRGSHIVLLLLQKASTESNNDRLVRKIVESSSFLDKINSSL